MAAEDFEKELDGGSKKPKNFWLVLIIIDVAALIFFGFMVYRSLSEKFAAPVLPKDSAPVKTTPSIPAPQTHALPPPQVQVVTPTPDIASTQTAAGVPAAQNLPPAAPQPVQPAPPRSPVQSVTVPPPVVKQQSVFIEPTNGKGRSVTFKYFGPAKKHVSIVSGFTMTKPQPLKKVDKAWQGTFVIYPGQYKYLFVVDGVKTLDPNADAAEGRSVVNIP